jgi:hypothetical protein
VISAIAGYYLLADMPMTVGGLLFSGSGVIYLISVIYIIFLLIYVIPSCVLVASLQDQLIDLF